MVTYWLCFTLQSAATFASGASLPGVVDIEVQHDADGLPYLAGRTLKGLLNEACADLLYALERAQPALKERMQAAAARLFGCSGAALAGASMMRVGSARLLAPLRAAVHEALLHPQEGDARLAPADILASLTGARTQTAIDSTGAALTGSLRVSRVILRGTHFEARLDCDETLTTDDDLALLCGCVLLFRRAGLGRNRGSGRLVADLYADQQGAPGDILLTRKGFELLRQEVQP